MKRPMLCCAIWLDPFDLDFVFEVPRPGKVVGHLYAERCHATIVNCIDLVASETTKNRSVAICAPIAPYAATRHEVRHFIERYGGFIEVHVSTPLEACEQRDRKGLYAN